MEIALRQIAPLAVCRRAGWIFNGSGSSLYSPLLLDPLYLCVAGCGGVGCFPEQVTKFLYLPHVNSAHRRIPARRLLHFPHVKSASASRQLRKHAGVRLKWGRKAKSVAVVVHTVVCYAKGLRLDGTRGVRKRVPSA
ncbi:hypothetical protein MPTK1_8g02420 [Marchantia polymorpha subsp. ruderalis]|uniref:Uncharacterized protein n=1 Tax=Marchantia polymorpha TaxID=3197 RepID=A0A2R6XIY6_MARPO|nr:hypothetical protein MARPO_0012s0039 [Marchantia polymorpha]BBN18430.1 hypothetical protein Mp_8g02420 [Marchantia polymorpha subsp. ruderalis]|eukprot:PTQ46077.1 hypothetical protein MARPO_0012s0039 [Marchantia polymorpha]